MTTISNSELLKDKDILNEINRHKWIESEKAGLDIGFEKATREWINAYSKEYLAQRPGKSAGLWIKSQPFYSILNKEIKLIG
jgi:hypothetical protein